MRHLFAAVACFAVFLIVVACGGSSSSSSTPTPVPSITDSPKPTPTARVPGSICTGADLYGALVLTQGAAGTIFYQLGVTNTGAQDCILVNPPVLHFRDASGIDLGVVSTLGTDCPAQGPFEPADCVDEDAVDLLADAATPAAGAAPGQLTVTVAVADIGALTPCASPTVQARSIGLRFTGLTDDVMIALPNDIALQTCPRQVRLRGYGPAKPLLELL